MGRLNNISGAKAVKAFKRAEWQAIGQVGSHLVMIKKSIPILVHWINNFHYVNNHPIIFIMKISFNIFFLN